MSACTLNILCQCMRVDNFLHTLLYSSSPKHTAHIFSISNKSKIVSSGNTLNKWETKEEEMKSEAEGREKWRANWCWEWMHSNTWIRFFSICDIDLRWNLLKCSCTSMLETSICRFHLEKFLFCVRARSMRLWDKTSAFWGKILFLSSSLMCLFEYTFLCFRYFLSLNTDEKSKNRGKTYKFYAVIYIQQIFCFSNFFHLQQYLLPIQKLNRCYPLLEFYYCCFYSFVLSYFFFFRFSHLFTIHLLNSSCAMYCAGFCIESLSTSNRIFHFHFIHFQFFVHFLFSDLIVLVALLCYLFQIKISRSRTTKKSLLPSLMRTTDARSETHVEI